MAYHSGMTVSPCRTCGRYQLVQECWHGLKMSDSYSLSYQRIYNCCSVLLITFPFDLVPHKRICTWFIRLQQYGNRLYANILTKRPKTWLQLSLFPFIWHPSRVADTPPFGCVHLCRLVGPYRVMGSVYLTLLVPWNLSARWLLTSLLFLFRVCLFSQCPWLRWSPLTASVNEDRFFLWYCRIPPHTYSTKEMRNIPR